MAHLLLDEDFDVNALPLLTRLGHNVITLASLGLANIKTPDLAVLATATHLGRAVLTFNRHDFISLHRMNPDHAGVIVCTRKGDIDSLVARIHGAIAPLSSLRGHLIRVNRNMP